MMPVPSEIPATPIAMVSYSTPVSHGDLLYFPTSAALDEVQRRAFKHWGDRFGPRLTDEIDADDEPVELIRMPPKRSFKIKMRIVGRKRGAVVPYDVTDIN